jgi:tetratricopeptide (TPR) repeat protein
MTILVSKVINFKTFLLAVLMCSFSCLSLAQSSNTKKQVQFVFDKLISVYGSAKSAPKCLVIKKAKFPVLPASYSTKNGPTIQIDEALYKVCQTFGKDSLNALAIVMSHELTHYYNDHTFCSDYAFANFKSNTPLKSKIGQASSSARIEKESEADIKGFFYAGAAGFQPHGLQGLLIGKIYTAYKLSDEQKGYPTKKERIAIANNAEKIAAQLYEYFKNGLIAIENKRYDEAIELFTKANSQVPFRENWNNIGIANTRKALILKENSEDEKLFPQKFLYPLEVENKSRLSKEITRGDLDDTSEEMEKLLKDAQKNFEEAIRLDPSFTKGYINLACVLDLLGDPEGAISKVTKQLLPKVERESIDAQRILAIAYFHSNVKEYQEKAEEIWKQLGK